MRAEAMRRLRALRLAAENLALRWIERLTRWDSSPHETRPRQILLFRNCFIGDLIVCTPALAALRQRHPEASVILVNAGSANPALQGVAVSTETHALMSRWIDRFVYEPFSRADVRGWLGRLRGHLRKLQPDVAAVVLYAEERFWAKLQKLLLLRAAGIGCRIVGADTAGSTAWLTPAARRLYGHRPPNQVEAAWRAIAPLLGPEASLGPAYPAFEPPDLEWVKALGRFIAVAPGSKLATFKSWPIARYVEFCRRHLQAQPQTRIVLIGGADDAPQCDLIVGSVGHERVTSLAGKTTLSQTAALLGHAAGYVGADSGPMHVAAYAGCPIVAIFSSYIPVAYWSPWTPEARVVQRSYGCDDCGLTSGSCRWGDYRCIRDIPVDEVLDHALQLFHGPVPAQRQSGIPAP